MSKLVEIVSHFAGNGGIVPRQAVACSRLETGQAVGGLAFSFWAVRNDCQVYASVL